MNKSPLSFRLEDGMEVKVVKASRSAYSFTFFSPSGKQKEILYRQVGRTRCVIKTGEPLEPYEHEALQVFWRHKK